jgi:hypothetical protein
LGTIQFICEPIETGVFSLFIIHWMDIIGISSGILNWGIQVD